VREADFEGKKKKPAFNEYNLIPPGMMVKM
jgi:hypothetical protein